MLQPGEVFQNSSSVLLQVHVLLSSPKKADVQQYFSEICSNLFLLTSAETITFKHKYLFLNYHDFELTQESTGFLKSRGPLAQKAIKSQVKFELVHTHSQGIIFCQLLGADCDPYSMTEQKQRDMSHIYLICGQKKYEPDVYDQL